MGATAQRRAFQGARDLPRWAMADPAAPAPDLPELGPLDRAFVLLRTGQEARAAEVLEAVLADEGDPALRLQAARLLGDAGALPRATAEVQALCDADPRDMAALHLLAEFRLRAGDGDRALPLFDRVLGADPQAMPAIVCQTLIRLAAGDVAPALDLWLRAIAAGGAGMARRGALLFADRGEDGAARACLAAAGLDPSGDYALQALTGEGGHQAAPAGWLRDHFDAFADTFDRTLGDLGNRGPALMADLAGRLGLGGGLRVLDAGCGTGLCAPFLRPIALHLTGCDLSPAMLARAALHPYDRLAELDLTALPGALPPDAAGGPPFDLILCTDVLVYFGALDAVLAALSACLAPGGWLLASFEHDPAPGPAGWRLLPSGRYAHGTEATAQALDRAGLEVRVIEADGVLRHEFGRPVPALVVAARRRA